MTTRQFIDDDEGYLQWLSGNPTGWVVNTYRIPSPRYLILHRSTCRTITGHPSHGEKWTQEYLKVCSTELDDIARWVLDTFRRDSIPLCGTCRPPRLPDSKWLLEPGQRLRRKDLHALMATTFGGKGGQRQGGISTPVRAPDLLLFTDPKTGRQHGYFDTWRDDGAFHYTGEGQTGDQHMIKGNRAILEHKARGLRLRLFDGSSGEVTYRGHFELANEHPWYTDDAPESGTGNIRKVIVFRLVPQDTAAVDFTLPTPPGPTVEQVSIELQHTETYMMTQTAQSIEAQRIEQGLVLAYEKHLKNEGHIVNRRRYTPTMAKPLYCDLYDETLGKLVEAKGSVTREAVRMAIGQLFDYARFESPGVKLAVLLPERPRPDLESLLLGLQIEIVFWTGESFQAITSA